MFDKQFLVGKVVNSLRKAGYEVLQTEGSFDVVAKNDKSAMLVKVLMNIDALKEDQALSLRAVAYFTGSQAIVVATKNNRETLDDDMVYSRFDVPVMTPKLLESIANEEDMPAVESSSGRHTMEVDAEEMRRRRKELGLTLETLAQKAGVSKKAVYEIENRRVKPTIETVEKIEEILLKGIQSPYRIRAVPPTHLQPRTEMQQKVSSEFSRMGIENTPVYSQQLENVGREKFSIMASISQNVEKIKRRAIDLRKLSGFLSTKAVVVTKRSHEKTVHGVPIVLESELPDIHTSKELKKVIEEKE